MSFFETIERIYFLPTFSNERNKVALLQKKWTKRRRHIEKKCEPTTLLEYELFYKCCHLFYSDENKKYSLKRKIELNGFSSFFLDGIMMKCLWSGEFLYIL